MGRKVGKKASENLKFNLRAAHFTKETCWYKILGISKHQYKNYLRSKLK